MKTEYAWIALLGLLILSLAFPLWNITTQRVELYSIRGEVMIACMDHGLSPSECEEFYF